jgi:hypothetical protein
MTAFARLVFVDDGQPFERHVEKIASVKQLVGQIGGNCEQTA